MTLFENENELVSEFVSDINTYPFATHIELESDFNVGRIDVTLPDYKVGFEAKGPGGNIKSGIGQAVTYREIANYKMYLLLPPSELSGWVVDVCKANNLGLVSTSPRTANFKLVNDVGGLESFYPGDLGVGNIDYTPEYNGPRETVVVGGPDTHPFEVEK